MSGIVVGIDHVQLAMPAGAEEVADRFYVEVLGLCQEPKPAALAARGGRWYFGGSARVHLGVETDFHPARKAHPALMVTGLDGLVRRLDESGHRFQWAEEIPGLRRGFVDDPFGNRVELIES